MKKVVFIFYFLLISFSAISQKNINNYKYIVVSDKVDFLKSTDQYQTSSLTKFLFNKYGFKAFLSSDKFPKDLNSNRCSALYADLKNISSFLKVKVKVQLKDCDNNIVYTSSEGDSKEKDYKKAYHESIRKAFESIKNLKYIYKPIISTEKNEVSFSDDKPKEVVKEIDDVPFVSPKTKITAVKEVSKQQQGVTILYAQVKENGFQLVDTTPKVIFLVLKTSQPTIFIIKDKNGILYKNDGIWMAEYYENNQLVRKRYTIKF